MDFHLEPHAAFGALLQEHPESAQFYHNCTEEQRRDIALQLGQIKSPEALRGFVAHLPSAAL